jgi:lysophospholipase L1-like esterase
MNFVNILFLGDSLTYGSRDKLGLSWVYDMAKMAMNEGYIIMPEIDAVPGRTSSELVRVALGRIVNTEARELFILIGTNDAKDENSYSAEDLADNLLLIINWAKAKQMRVYLFQIPIPSGFGSPNYTVNIINRIKSYNEKLKGLPADEYILLDMIDEYEDGIHLSRNSAKMIAAEAWKVLKKMRTF